VKKHHTSNEIRKKRSTSKEQRNVVTYLYSTAIEYNL
jgi:hypothetical protein